MQYKIEEYDQLRHDKFFAIGLCHKEADMVKNGLKSHIIYKNYTKYRGEVLICEKNNHKNSLYGRTICKADLVDVKRISYLTAEEKATLISDGEICLNTYFIWMLKNIRPVIEFPIKARSGMFTLIFTKDQIIEYPVHFDMKKWKDQMHHGLHETMKKEKDYDRKRKRFKIQFISLLVIVISALTYYFMFM